MEGLKGAPVAQVGITINLKKCLSIRKYMCEDWIARSVDVLEDTFQWNLSPPAADPVPTECLSPTNSQQSGGDSM